MSASIFRQIKDNVIGRNTVYDGPFGARKLIYCDYTASGKALEYIEKFINEHVYPYYANTHTTSSVSGSQTSTYREDARRIILNSVNGDPNEDVVIFAGSGATAAIHKMLSVIGLNDSSDPAVKKTVVIFGPFEHHSNILPWRESAVTVERIEENTDGLIDMDQLEDVLKKYYYMGYRIIVTLSAASNVTGIITDTNNISRMVHKYNGLVFWDYASAAPYMKIDMNPEENETTRMGNPIKRKHEFRLEHPKNDVINIKVYTDSTPTIYVTKESDRMSIDPFPVDPDRPSCKDAVFIAPHKFVGGVGTPGVLVAKRRLFTNKVPHGCGGGTVAWVTRENHEYLDDIAEREEGGTPDIVGSIRAGLAFQLKSAVGEDLIMERERELCLRAFHRWQKVPGLFILGSATLHRLPIFSFIIAPQQYGKFLHYNFVAALLNDLYGIQVRGGCACAGPYGADLFDMDEPFIKAFSMLFYSEKQSKSQSKPLLTVMKPGFTRLNFPYFMDDEAVEFILRAVETIALEGWKLLPLYSYDASTGAWKNRRNRANRRLQHLDELSISYPVHDEQPVHALSYTDVERSVRKLIDNYHDLAVESDAMHDKPLELEDHHFLWFLQPGEVCAFILNPNSSIQNARAPFYPRKYPRRSRSLNNSRTTPSKSKKLISIKNISEPAISTSRYNKRPAVVSKKSSYRSQVKLKRSRSRSQRKSIASDPAHIFHPKEYENTDVFHSTSTPKSPDTVRHKKYPEHDAVDANLFRSYAYKASGSKYKERAVNITPEKFEKSFEKREAYRASHDVLDEAMLSSDEEDQIDRYQYNRDVWFQRPRMSITMNHASKHKFTPFGLNNSYNKFLKMQRKHHKKKNRKTKNQQGCVLM